MMAAPLRKAKAREDNRTFVAIEPKPGTILLWESFLRHEVPVNQGTSERITVSFNCRWDQSFAASRPPKVNRQSRGQ